MHVCMYGGHNQSSQQVTIWMRLLQLFEQYKNVNYQINKKKNDKNYNILGSLRSTLNWGGGGEDRY